MKGMSLATNDLVQLSCQFDATAEMIFEAWIDPSVMRQWLFVGPGSEIVKVETNPREGGVFSILEHNDGEEIDHFGEYVRVDRPTLLVFTLEVPKHFPGVTEVRVGLTPTASGCEMQFEQKGVAREVTEESWRVMFRTLRSVIDASTGRDAEGEA
jgi:uncharacterized protein YndB with AHSA1/START domain